jgi:hypothetical protein
MHFDPKWLPRSDAKKACACSLCMKRTPEELEERRRTLQLRAMKQGCREETRKAIRIGQLVKPFHCERCPDPGPLTVHHLDYTRPLDIEWLCRTCHDREHGVLPREERMEVEAEERERFIAEQISPLLQHLTLKQLDSVRRSIANSYQHAVQAVRDATDDETPR